MAEPFSWVPAGVNTEVPSAARVYDFLLGGEHNFPADRFVGEKVLQALPMGRQIAASNRAFLHRAVRYMIDRGITQFIDLGSGIPTGGNVHEVAQQAEPDARVVYVDNDEVAVAHSQLLLEGNENAAVVMADLTQPGSVLKGAEITRLIDFDRPVGLLLVAVLHFIPDEKDPAGIVGTYRDAVPPGSLVALSHLTADFRPDEMADVVEAMRNSRDPMYFRSYAEFDAVFDGLEVVEPGVVSAPKWHPELGPAASEGPQDVYAGVAHKA